VQRQKESNPHEADAATREGELKIKLGSGNGGRSQSEDQRLISSWSIQSF
jgi:hypothetical protein